MRLNCDPENGSSAGQSQVVQHRYLQSSVTVVFAWLFTCALAPYLTVDAVSQSRRGSETALFLAGRVVALSNGDALRRVSILVIGASDSVGPVFTDDGGRFSVTLPRNGPFTLIAVKAGYLERRAVLNAADVATASVQALELQLTRGAAVTGRVADVSGSPLVTAQITARRLDTAVQTGAGTQWATETDDLGQYRLAGLTAGRYAIAVTPVSTDRFAGTQSKGESLNSGVYEDSTKVITSPIAVTLTTGDETSGIDFVVDTSATLPNVIRGQGSKARPTSEVGKGYIIGRVVDEADRPIADARIRISQVGMMSWFAITDTAGQFGITNLPPGHFRITASKTGYVTTQYGQTRATESGRVVTLNDRHIASHVRLLLSRGRAITGTVIDEWGEPAEGLIVQALQLRFLAGRTVALPPPNTPRRRTDDRGSYRLFGLLPGEYLIVAALDSAQTRDRPTLLRHAPAPVYYPGTPAVLNASAVTLDTHRDVTGLHIVFRESSTVSVSGTVLNVNGQPLKGTVLLTESQRSGAVTLGPRSAPIGPDGHFVISGVCPGEYVVQALGPMSTDGDAEFATLFVNVSTVDPAPLLLRTSRGSALSGRILIDGQTEVPIETISLQPYSADFDYAPLIGSGVALTIERDGMFRVRGLTGPIRFVLSNAPEGWYIESVRINNTDFVDRPFNFGLQYQLFDDAQITISRDGARVIGRVFNSRSEPVSDYTVVIFVVDQDKWFPHSNYVKFARPSHDNSFALSGLPPGNYWIATLSEIDAGPGIGDWQRPEVLTRLSWNALRIELHRGEKREVNVRLGGL